jgi:hypothetical protein
VGDGNYMKISGKYEIIKLLQIYNYIHYT